LKNLTLYISFFISAGFLLSSCAGTTKPMHTERATPGIVSMSYHSLKELPEPEEKVVAAVYRFRDQTGQYKPSDRIASWSTAVTQGATSILMKAMEESGWFIPIERESISNLLNERQIIQNIRQAHSGPQGPQPLPPLLFAGVILEGGIVGYDTNVITGGLGARYLGTGGSGQYRKDQVTIYLRAVSTQSGRVLKTVHTTKSIVSQQLDSGVFRFIDTNRLLEAEAGYTYNEPPVMAVTEAIDEALKLLVLEGIEDEIWIAKNPEEVQAYRDRFNYHKQLEEQVNRDYFGFIDRPQYREGWSVSSDISINSMIGNYANPDLNPGFSVRVERFLNSDVSLNLRGSRGKVSAPGAFSTVVNSGDVMLNYYVTSGYRLSPFLAAGGGAFIIYNQFEGSSDSVFPYAAFESGFDYRFSPNFGMRLSGEYRYLTKDGLDGISEGKYNDQHWGINVGFIFQP